ncbi:MAG: hypothetical protein JXR37_03815 [Kiritimatiellae bacterium]|nr:hypothetical protein [Kiritimatiellia bacterium]
MRRDIRNYGLSVAMVCAVLRAGVSGAVGGAAPDGDAPLPAGAPDTDRLDSAWRRSSPTRAELCLNGLWRFRPVLEGDAEDGVEPPAGRGWGWFKVPGLWPAGGKGPHAQDPVLPGAVRDRLKNGGMDRAWYKRSFEAPAIWAGRRISLEFRMVRRGAHVWIDGQEAGSPDGPGGRLDITALARPGKRQVLSMLVKKRGITGDLFLSSEPAADRIADVDVRCSTRKQQIEVEIGLEEMRADRLRCEILVLEHGTPAKRFETRAFGRGDIRNGRVAFAEGWPNPKTWDTHTPGNTYELVVRLKDGQGRLLDESLPLRFGFREFWIDGRDFRLNGTPIRLRALRMDAQNEESDRSCLEACRAACRDAKRLGFNAFIAWAGDVGYLDALFEAADEEGLLMSFHLPGITAVKNLKDPEQAKRYRRLLEWWIRRVRNHPSVVLYSMNPNLTQYTGGKNPLRIDGVFDPDAMAGTPLPSHGSRAKARQVAAIAGRLDPTRPIYHHNSGHLGDVYNINIYLNWAPIQERSDWLEHWATAGAKPVFFVEWGLPYSASFQSYRGPKFIYGNKTFQCIWDSEYAAAHIGQPAYEMSAAKQAMMRDEERRWARGEPWEWSHMGWRLSESEPTYQAIQALYNDDNWRSHRTWGLSGIDPWPHSAMWRRVRAEKGAANARRFESLQAPGIVPDFLRPAAGRWVASDLDGAFALTALGRSVLRWNRPLLGYIGGAPRFTDKTHVYAAGERIAKQLVVLNDGRTPVACEASWRLTPSRHGGRDTARVAPGGKTFVPLAVPPGATREPGEYVLRARFDFGNGEVQEDEFPIRILAPGRPRALRSRAALFDPKGMTARLLNRLGVQVASVGADDSLAPYELLIVGREAVTLEGRLPDLATRKGPWRVLVFEQTAKALEKRFGFRIQEYGLRKTFVRAAGHPALEGLPEDALRDWRGAATLTPPHFTLPEATERTAPTWQWCGFAHKRVWRCGNSGNVASVLIEKPTRGNFLPLVDGGFDLQYAPLLELVEGDRRFVFCQLDVTGRSTPDAAADRLCANLLGYLDTAQPAASRRVLYSGDARGSALLEELGISFQAAAGAPLDTRALLVIGPGSTGALAIGGAVERGLNVLCLGLDGNELDRVVPGAVRVARKPTVPSLVRDFSDPALAGLSNAELHWRTELEVAALEPDADGAGNEALRVLRKGAGRIVLCQAAPWMFDYRAKPYLRTTWRRNAFLVSRLLDNLGAGAAAGLTRMWTEPLPATPGAAGTAAAPGRWLASYYLQAPESDDDPYRYYQW